jgi:hypothetical protein
MLMKFRVAVALFSALFALSFAGLTAPSASAGDDAASDGGSGTGGGSGTTDGGSGTGGGSGSPEK